MAAMLSPTCFRSGLWSTSLHGLESGPIAQCIAGLDIALNDLIAKKEQIPLWKKFGGKKHLVPIYASGINPSSAEDQVKFALKNYFQAFKLKVGFGMETDLHNLKIIRKYIGKNHSLMIDANQGWDEKNAIENCNLNIALGNS